MLMYEFSEKTEKQDWWKTDGKVMARGVYTLSADKMYITPTKLR
jgi:hypothetical protein